MASVCIPGRLSKLVISDDGGQTYQTLGGVVDLTLNINIDELETTTHDSNGTREYMPNHSDFSIDAAGRWEDGDPGQEIVLNAVDSKATLLFQFTMETKTGAKRWDGSCFPTNAAPKGPLEDTAGMDVSFRCSGVSRTVQPTV